MHTLTPFVGRDRDVTALTTLLGSPEVRLVTLLGPGGIGKTRLALRVAEMVASEFPAGVVVVSMVAVTDAELVLPTIAGALELGDASDHPLIDRLGVALRGRRMLLVLDNLEQVIGGGPQLARLLRVAPETVILATSRSPLRIEGEHEHPIAPLGVPRSRASLSPAQLLASDAGAFFIQCARRVNPGFAVQPEAAPTIAEICRRLDGLPLALELAAARIMLLTPQELLARLDRRLPLLTTGMRERHPRQQTMRGAIAWSIDLLDAAHQTQFRRLAVFQGGFTLASAHQFAARVAAANGEDLPDLLDVVAVLADQSLISRQDTEGTASRYGMLETIREYGHEQLGLAGEIELCHASFAELWLQEAEASWSTAERLADLSQALARLEEDHDNIRAALRWLEDHDIAGALELAGALFWLWYVRGHHSEAHHTLRRLLARPRSNVAPRILARALMAAGVFAHFQADTPRGNDHLEEALNLWRDLQDTWGTGFTLFVLGVIAEDLGNYEHAQELLEEAVALLESIGDHGSVGSARYHLAVVAFGMGKLEQSQQILQSLLDDDLAAPVLRVTAWAHHLRGLVCLAQGNVEKSLHELQTCLRGFQSFNSPPGIAEGLAGLAVVAAVSHEPLAIRLWGAAERIMTDRGDAFQLPERSVYETLVDSLREKVGEEQFEREIALGRAWTTEEAIESALALTMIRKPAVPTGPLARLSERERQVMELITLGWTNDRIAEHLFVSPRTVQTHLTAIYRKLDVLNRTEATRIALAAGMNGSLPPSR
jgi:predicted ATPase/DNA-binding CsgD family transcriptional regulator